MRVLLPTLACLALLPAAAQAKRHPAPAPAQAPESASHYLSTEAGPPSGEVITDAGHATILAEPPPVGQRVKVPEGWWQVDSEPQADRRAPGTFTRLAPRAFYIEPPAAGAKQVARATPPPEEMAPAGLPPPPPYGPSSADIAEACRPEREAYAKRLLYMAGIFEVDHPLDLAEGLAAGDSSLSPWLRFNMFGLPGGGPYGPTSLAGVDPVRPVGWDFELQSDARELAKCVAEQREND